MDINKLGAHLIAIMDGVAPLIGLSDEVEAARKVIDAVTGAYETVKDAFDPAQRANLEAGLSALADRVNDHAERTKDSLG